MTTVCIESPFAGDQQRNVFYARACMKYCFDRGVVPFASHLLYPQILDDEDPKQREMGIDAGHVFGDRSDERWFFIDFEWSPDMKRALERAHNRGQSIQRLKLGDENGNWETQLDPSRIFRAEFFELPTEAIPLELLSIIRRLKPDATPYSLAARAITNLQIACDHLNRRK